MPTVPRVSVVIPTYNRERTIVRAVQSVLAQTMGDLEVLVVDDGSTDGTEALVRGIGDSRVIFLRPYEGNRGPAAARNAGIRAAKGPYVSFQDSDDEWAADKLEKQLRALEASPEVGVVYGTIKVTSPSKVKLEPDPKVFPKDGDMHIKLLERSMVGTPVALVRRSLLEKVGGFDEGLRSIEDWDLFLRLSRECRFAFIDEVLCFSYTLSDSLNADYGKRIDTLEKILQKHGADYKENPKAFMGFCLEIGIFRYQKGDAKNGKSWVWRGAWAYPFALGPIALVIASIFGRRCFLAVQRLVHWVEKSV